MRTPKLKILREEELKNRICVIVGTRPGIIKFSPIIRKLEIRKIDYFKNRPSQKDLYEAAAKV